MSTGLTRILVVATGGALGAVCRYFLTLALDQTLPSLFPVGTFVINLGGSFALGFVYELSTALALPVELRLLAGTGFLGAFTTFSTLAFEVNALARAKAASLGALYAVASVVAGVALCSAGMLLGRTVARAS